MRAHRIDRPADGVHLLRVSTVTLLEAKDRLPELVRAAEAGETIILTRDGEPVAEITAMSAKKLSLEQRLEALAEYKKKHGIERFIEYIPEDFDDPLPEDFLIRPLPPEK